MICTWYFVSLMKQEYISYWQNTLHHSQKLEFFRSFKSDHTTSNYQEQLRVKLQISNHKLMIELARHNQTTTNNRNYPFYRSNQIEDKIHFLFNSSKYSFIRNSFYNKVKILIPNITQLSVNALISELINTSIIILIYNSWNIFQRALTFATNY